MTNDTARILAYCEQFATEYRAAGSPADIAGIDLPAWPLEVPSWAVHATVTLVDFPSLYVEYERHLTGDDVAVEIAQGGSLAVETTDGAAAGVIAWGAPVIYIDPDGRDQLTPAAARELLRLLSAAEPIITAAEQAVTA